jgi:hypothetical protein
MMWNLRMALRQKFAVSAVLSVGWIVAILDIVRVEVFYDFWYPSSTSNDPTYKVSITLSGIEVNVGIMTACGPALKALATRCVPNLFSSKSTTQTNAYHTREYETNSGAGTTKSGRFVTTALQPRDNNSDSQAHIVRDSSSYTDNKSIEAPSIKEAAAVPNSNTWTTSKG